MVAESDVLALRQALLPPQSSRQRLCALDLCDPRWWDQLGLAPRESGEPLFLFSEGVLMYLPPHPVRQVLAVHRARRLAPLGAAYAGALSVGPTPRQ